MRLLGPPCCRVSLDVRSGVPSGRLPVRTDIPQNASATAPGPIQRRRGHRGPARREPDDAMVGEWPPWLQEPMRPCKGHGWVCPTNLLDHADADHLVEGNATRQVATIAHLGPYTVGEAGRRDPRPGVRGLRLAECDTSRCRPYSSSASPTLRACRSASTRSSTTSSSAAGSRPADSFQGPPPRAGS